MSGQMPSADGLKLEIPDAPAQVEKRAKVGRLFNMALLAAGQRDCPCHTCAFMNSIAQLSIDQAASELVAENLAAATPPAPAAVPPATEPAPEPPSPAPPPPAVTTPAGSTPDAGDSAHSR